MLVQFEDQILPTLLTGAEGAISCLSNVAPELFVNMVRAGRNCDLETATQLHRRVLSLLAPSAYSDPPIGAIKLTMKKLGVPPIQPTVCGPVLPAPAEFEGKIEATLKAVHSALVETLKITEDDRIQRLHELPPNNFEIPPGKTEMSILVHITMFPDRSVEAKRCLYQVIVRNLGRLGIDPEDVFIILYQPPVEDWGIRGDLPASEVVDLGFEVNV